MVKGEKNVFRDAKFGDKFLTRNGQVMIYQKQVREDVYCLFDEEGDCVIEYRPNGDVIYEYTGDAEPQEDDIVKKYVQPSLPSDLDEAAEKYANKEFPDEPSCGQWGTGDYEPPVDMEYPREITKDAFKAGAKWQAEQILKSSPLPEDTVLFNKGVEEGKRLAEEEQADLLTIVALDAAQRAKEQMMKEAVETELYWDGDFLAIDLNMRELGYSEHDKVCIIILPKED